MTHIYSYPSIYAIGHKAIADLLKTPVVIEEKVDGSQFSFGIVDGELTCRSKGADIIIDAPEKMFSKAVQTVRELEPLLFHDVIYRCEYLQKPKHNSLAYDRVPNKHLIVFDISTGLEEYMKPEDKRQEAERLGLECVPVIYQGIVSDLEQFNALLDTVSILGGQKIEGVVAKNYSLFTQEKKIAIGKYVSERFKEIHSKQWKTSNPGQGDILNFLIEKYKTPARWNKAIQHLRDAGELEGSPRDIGKLIKEVPADIQKECEDEIKEVLFAHFWPKIRRGVTGGLPEWYKQELAKEAFSE